jgi:radical SAM protein with 4Fe4S-binding SPASM domain
MFRMKHTLIHTLLEITLKCNMKCVHCGSSAGYKRENELSTKQWINVCDQLADLNCRQITLMGGEPLVRKDWHEIASHVRNKDINLTVMSNGYLINETVINQLRTLEPYAVAISLDGATEDTHDYIRGMQGSFKRCIQALDLLIEADLPTTVVTTVHKMNLNDLQKIRNLLINRKIAWQIQMGTPFGRFPSTLTLSLEEFYAVAMFIAATKKQFSVKELPITGAHCMGYHSSVLPNLMVGLWKGCYAGMNVLGIQSNGGIKGCLSLPDDFIEGNINEVNISDVWNNADAFNYNRNFRKDKLKNYCNECKYGYSCRGGCISSSISLAGKTHCNPYCLYRIEKEIIAK